MSLNEIYNNPNDNSVKGWQNYRFNNLNIQNNFNIDTTGATVGDVLQLDAGLDNTWVNYSDTNSNSVDSCSVGFSNLFTLIQPNQTSLVPMASITSSGPIFNLTAQSIGITQQCSLIVMVNLTSVPIPAAMPVFQLQKITSAVSVELLNFSPYRTSSTNVSPDTTITALAPVQCLPGDLLRIYAACAVPGSTAACTFVPAESSVSVIRIA